MNFGQALDALKSGKRVSREGWLCSQTDMLADDWGVLG